MIVGIDLGTTHSLIGIYEEGKSKLFLNPLNQLLTPSVISLMDDGSIVVGEIAKQRLSTHPHLTASVFKRYMGTSREIKLGNKTYLPEELSSIVLRSLIDDAENATGQKVTEAVISVPAYFSDAQRKATRIAGQLAGIKVERLINEPTAAALAYGLQDREDKGHFLMIDLGGGTFDVSILEIFDNIVEVHATAGDNFLGGEDFTHALVNAFCKEQNINKDSLNNQEQILLSNQLEKIKQSLTKNNSSELIINLSGKEYRWTVTEESFAKHCEALIQRMRIPVERTVRDAKLSASDIDEIVLVGGASRMSLVGKLVALMFKRFPLKNINPDETIAIGVTIAAGLKARDSNLEEVILTDVCPYTLGIEIGKRNEQTGSYVTGFFMPIIDRNSTVPISRVETVSPIEENQKRLKISVYQGESAKVNNNINLGELIVYFSDKNISNKDVDVRFTYDINGILQVEATVNATGKTEEIFLRGEANTMSDAEIKQRFQELSNLKTHPRDKQENIILISRAERIYQEYLEYRDQVQHWLMIFQHALETQDENKIKEARNDFSQALSEIENE